MKPEHKVIYFEKIIEPAVNRFMEEQAQVYENTAYFSIPEFKRYFRNLMKGGECEQGS